MVETQLIIEEDCNTRHYLLLPGLSVKPYLCHSFPVQLVLVITAVENGEKCYYLTNKKSCISGFRR